MRFRGVSFAYPSRPEAQVLRSLDLLVPAGKNLAVVGSSGSGKSTLAALLTRLYDPGLSSASSASGSAASTSSGSLELDGVDLRLLDPHWLRSNIAVVAQEPVLFATSIAENIRYGRPGASQEQVLRAAKLANAADFIAGFPDGFETTVGERGAQLSGGQKQRIAIARAILKDAPVLILDEATSALVRPCLLHL